MVFIHAINYPRDDNFKKNVEECIDTLTEQMAITNKALLNPQIEDDIRKPIEALLDQLGKKLGAAQTNRRSLPELTPPHSQNLKSQIHQIKTQVQAKRAKLPIETMSK